MNIDQIFDVLRRPENAGLYKKAAPALDVSSEAIRRWITGERKCAPHHAAALLDWWTTTKPAHAQTYREKYVARKEAAAATAATVQHLRIEDVSRALEKLQLPKIVAKGYARRKSVPNTSSAITAPIGDAHTGMVQESPAVEQAYNPALAARAHAYVCEQVCRYKLEHRQEHELIVPILGDMIHGELPHVLFSSVGLAYQQVAELYYVSQMIAEYAAEFKKVRVYWLFGNHERNITRSPKRALSQKEESHGMIIAAALKLACASLPNVEIHVVPGAFATWQTFNWNFAATHGDSDMLLRGPTKARGLNVIEAAVEKIKATNRLGVKPDLFLLAHFHIGVLTPFTSTPIMIVPPLAPRNGFDYANGYDGRSGAWIFHSTPEHLLGHTFPLQIGPEVYARAELDDLIRPCHGLHEVETWDKIQ